MAIPITDELGAPGHVKGDPEAAAQSETGHEDEEEQEAEGGASSRRQSGQSNPIQQQMAANSSNYNMEGVLPPTKIKRQYKCTVCDYITVNPRDHLHHRKNIHGHKIKVVECPRCVYACQYRQKLHRHLRLVHNYPPAANNQSGGLAPRVGGGGEQSRQTKQQRQQHQRQLKHQQQQQLEQQQQLQQLQQLHQLQQLQLQLQSQQFAFLRLDYINAYASQLIPFHETTYSEPVDLSFPDSLKQLIKTLERQQV